MNAKLISIAGPLRGAVFALPTEENGEFSIGRSTGNSLCLEDPLVSRRHCVVSKTAGQYTLVDRGSANRTYINGLPSSRHTLRDRDEIKVGESLLLFVDEVPDAAGEQPPPGARTTIHLSDTLLVRTADVSGRPPAPSASSAAGPRWGDALLALSEGVNSIRGVEALESHILDSLAMAIPADHGFVALPPATVVEWKKAEGAARQGRVPPALVEKLLRERIPLIWNGGPEIGIPDLQHANGITALVACPLSVREQFLGIVCLCRADGRACFEAGHLDFLRRAAGLASVLLAGAQGEETREADARQRQAEINLEHNMVGESQPMRKVYELIARVAPAESTVLICGESGTGKELAARAIHRNSLRSRGPFVAINCAALTETLLESELFGHERGAFTGAVAQKKGKLEEAAGGSVFLDEIGEMSPVLQAKLLRVLQEREFERVGGTQPIKANIRVIAATNRNLEEALRSGRFRQDLFYRLNVVKLTMPPLRERREDIPLLANYFAQKHGRNLKKWIGAISSQAHACLKGYDWPGNVRELENVIERALVLGASDTIRPEDLPESVLESAHSPEVSGGSFHGSIKDWKKQLIMQTLEKTDGNYTEAARLLDLHPNSLHRIIRNLNIKVKTAS